MTPRAVGPVNADFYSDATTVLRQMYETAEATVRPLVAMTAWEIHYQPTSYHLSLLTPPPQPDQMLLGLFTSPPPTICLFEQPIRQAAAAKGVSLTAQIREVAIHELAQHRFGLNHMHDQPAPAAAANLMGHHP